MERVHCKRIPRSKKERVGLPTALLDCEGTEVLTGDIIHLIGSDYMGPVMWNRHYDCYGVFMGLWHGAKDPLDPDCYGKFIAIPQDNGMRMQLKKEGSL